MKLLVVQFKFFILVVLFVIYSTHSNKCTNFYKVKGHNSKFYKIRNSRVSVEISKNNNYLAKKFFNIETSFKEHRYWTLFKSHNGLLMLGVHEKGRLYRFLTYRDGVIRLSSPQTANSQICSKLFQLVHGKLMHYETEEYFCSKEKLCKEYKEGNFVIIK